MASLGNYKGLEVFTTNPSGTGGLAINNDFKALVDWNPKSNWAATADPTADDDSTDAPAKNYQVGSLWYRTDTGVLFLCTDATPTAAVWKLVLVQPNTNKPLQGDAGGNTRGEDATDFQRARSADTQVASAKWSTIGGGFGSKADGVAGTVAGGRGNWADGESAVCIGGRQNRALSDYSTTIGAYAKTSNYGHVAIASGFYATHGDAQASILVARNETSNATATELFLDGSSERLVLPSTKTWAFSGLLVARRTDADNESAGWKFEGVIDNFSGSVALVGTPAVTSIGDDSGGAWTFAVTADGTNDALKLEVTGEASKTIRWVAKVNLAEVGG